MINIHKLSPFKHFCVHIGNIPSAYEDSMSYYEMLRWFCKFLKDEVIPTVNTNAEAVSELQQYVEHYFDNLDVQNEINNKLDQMASDGTLEEIIASYLNTKAILGFDNIQSLKNATNLINGSYVKTMGYYVKNDNGGANYYVTDDSLIADDSTIIELNNGLFAILLTVNSSITPEQFGCYGDGIHDDTVKMQSCINYGIANRKQINFCGNYKVSPIEQEDGTKLCLYVYRDNTDESHGTDSNISFNFIRDSKIFTDYNEECTLIRFNISNINFENALLDGVLNKTTLIEFSKIDKLSTTESQWTSYNIFRNCMLLHSKNAITMEGRTYYNTFDKCTIRYCQNGIILDFTALEKMGLTNNSNVNRNDFNNITIQNSTGKGIAIYYGDTNKFTNISFEGCADCIYIDDPQKHTSDFPITPLYYTEQNMFINIIAEAITGTKIYNNSGGLKIINTSIRYQDSSNNFLVSPQLYIGAGANANNSIEKIEDIYKTLEDVPYENIQKYSTFIDSLNGTTSRYYSDFQKDGTTYKMLSRRNLLFNENNIVNLKANTSLTYESTYKCVTKQIGGIVFLTTKFSMQPDNLNSNIELPLDSSITHNNQFGGYYSIPALEVPVFVTINNIPTLIRCRIGTNKLVLYPPVDGWSSTITVLLNLHWFRDTLQF